MAKLGPPSDRIAGPGYSFLGSEEAALVEDVLQSWQLSRYRFTPNEELRPSMVYRFEQEMAALLGVKQCIAVNSCASALFIALRALGVGDGDEVIVPGYTFIATIAAVVYAGAVPVLAEIDESLTLDPADVETKVTPKTKAIVAVHMLGAPCDMEALTALATKHGLRIVEDVAQAAGGSYQRARLGSLGDIGCFSLNIYKTITAGVGGWIACDDDRLYEHAFAIHDHGVLPVGQSLTDGSSIFGLNFRMNELTAAVALGQTRKLDAILAYVRRQKARLQVALGDVPGTKRRRLNDSAGECGTLLVLIFDDPFRAQSVAAELGTVTLIDSGRHYYGNMSQLRHYQRGMLPRTDDLLGRAIALSVGVVDGYLGAGFGIDVRSSPTRIAAVARRFRDAADAVAT